MKKIGDSCKGDDDFLCINVIHRSSSRFKTAKIKSNTHVI